MSDRRRVWLVGEHNPYGADPEFALYPLPANATGGRLQRLILGVSMTDYMRHYERVNLCTDKFSVTAARQAAGGILFDLEVAGRTAVRASSARLAFRSLAWRHRITRPLCHTSSLATRPDSFCGSMGLSVMVSQPKCLCWFRYSLSGH